MNSDQPYIRGVAAAFEAAGFEKIAISRWLASQFGLGVGKAIDKTTEELQTLSGEEPKKPKEPKEPKPPKAPEAPKEPEPPAEPDEDIVDTPEEVEALILEAAGIELPPPAAPTLPEELPAELLP